MGEEIIYRALLNGMEYVFPNGEVPEVGAEYFINGKFYIVTFVGLDGTVEMEESRRQVKLPAEIKPLEIPVPAESNNASLNP